MEVIRYLATAILLLVLLEQLSYWRKKRHAAGPSLVLPFLGSVISLVRDPTRYWFDQARNSARTGFSTNYLIGRFILFIKDTELSQLVFSNVKPDAFMLVGHPFGKKLFGDHNLIYMFGQPHKDLRARIAPNFTPKALSTYVHLQQEIISGHLREWAERTGPVSLRALVREMNLETSQTVFVGPYLGRKERERFKVDYNLFNLGLMALPVDFPGFAFRKARLAVGRLAGTLAGCVKRSKERMRDVAGAEPECLIDFWMQEMLRETASSEGKQPPANSSDEEIGGFLFDFLFAAQDASTSSLLWAVALLESHPEILARVRSEVSSVWSPATGAPMSADQVREMAYTQAVAREVLRYRAPATMVPHIAMRDLPLADTGYTIPKGTIVFPSVFESSFQGFTDPDRFDPDRFGEDRREDQVYRRNFLAFGAGAHQCVGQRYALNHLVLFMAIFVSVFDFKRHRTEGCDDIVYNPTICPKDGCTVFLSRRGGWES